MNRRMLLVALALVAAAALWWAFRPERLFIDAQVSESLAGAEALLLEGEFHPVAHEGKGRAAVHRLADGRRVLRFTGLETSNGPDLQVYLVAAPDARDAATVKEAGFVALGALKGNIGDQNYDIPAEVDLAKYRAVTVWCRRFGVNFATAPLAPPGR